MYFIQILSLGILMNFCNCQNEYHLNIDEVLSNERLVRNYVDCLVDKAPCTPEGEKLKKDIPEALEDGCATCTDKQKDDIRKVLKYLAENRKEWFKEIVAKFDPEGRYKKKYGDLIEKEGLVV